VKSTNYGAPHHAIFFTLLSVRNLIGPNILLSTKFSKTLNLCSSLNVRDQVWHPYQTTGKTSFVYFNLNLLVSRRRNKNSEQRGSKHSPILVCSYFPRECKFDLFHCFRKYERFHMHRGFISYPNILALYCVYFLINFLIAYQLIELQCQCFYAVPWEHYMGLSYSSVATFTRGSAAIYRLSYELHVLPSRISRTADRIFTEIGVEIIP
jgi:hypothetical protein